MAENGRSRTLLWIIIGGGAFFLFVLAVFTLVYLALHAGGENASLRASFGDKIGVVELEGVILDPSIVVRLIAEDLVPVIATVGVDEAGQAYNVNADTVAGAIAESLAAEKLVYLTDVSGIYARWPDESSIVSRTDVAGLEQLMTTGAIGEGMIPKIESCIAALQRGVRRAHILDGRLEHALLLEFFTKEGVGTMVTP